MKKVIQVTDTHLVERGRALYGLDPAHNLRHCVQAINTEQGDADLCIITGDLAHKGHPEAYEQLQEILDGLAMPYRLILGNHDSRPNFLAQFADSPVDAEGFVQYTMDMGHFLGVFLDTNHPGVSYGVFCEQRGAWLRSVLEVADKPVLLFMHHPSFPIGIPSMDRISLIDTAAFELALQGQAHKVRHLFFGHIHRPIFGSWRGMPFSTIRGTNHQLVLDLQPRDNILGVNDPAQYAVVLLGDDQVTVHPHDFGRHTPVYFL